MNHDKATEEFFRLRGWVPTKRNLPLADHLFGDWIMPDGELSHLPNICESMTDWIKYVAEFMEGEGYDLYKNKFDIIWSRGAGFPNTHYKPIKDHQILYASVLAANEYLKEKK